MPRLIAVSNRVQVETEGQSANRGGLAVALAAGFPFEVALLHRALDRRDITPAGSLNVMGDCQVCALFAHVSLLPLVTPECAVKGVSR